MNVRSLVARQAVAAYQAQPMLAGTFGDAEKIALPRLESDPDGKVSAALNQLKLRRTETLVFYLLQSVDLVLQADVIQAHHQSKAQHFEEKAAQARDLIGDAPIAFKKSLMQLADFFNEQAQHHADAPAKLQISQKAEIDNAAAYLALRHFGRRLREELHMTHLRHDPIRWLIEAALELPRIPDNVVSDALRRGVGISKRQPRHKSAKCANALKQRGKSGALAR